jgi:uncharacterized protein (DUF488 family)
MALESPRETRGAFFTIGHSNRSFGEFVALLQSAGVDTIVDVRKMPRSRSNPQFNGEDLSHSLEAYQIGYVHLAALGGLRSRTPAIAVTPNGWWRNRSFRNYADYALTPPFQRGLAELLDLGRRRTCAIMCAEALWWRCHRRIIADYLLSEGAEVLHILGPNHVERAHPTPALMRTAAGLLYPAPAAPVGP